MKAGPMWEVYNRFVDSLPAKGGTIVVLTNDVGRHIRRGLRVRRGRAVALAWRHVVVACPRDVEKVRGLRGDVIVDPGFIERSQPEVMATVDLMIVGARLALAWEC